MSWEINKEQIEKQKGKNLYLLDSSVFVRAEEIEEVCKIDLISVIKGLRDEYFFITNDVLVEIANGPRNLNYQYFLNHLLQSEGAMDKNWKENRFLVEEAGEIRYVVLNKISSTDYGQVLLCQNHKELTLVSNDRKLLRSSARLFPGRVLGLPIFINRLAEKYPEENDLKTLKNTVLAIYPLKENKLS